MSALLVLVCLVQAGAPGVARTEWLVRDRGAGRLEVEAVFAETEPGQGYAVARLVPAPGGELPVIELVELDTVVTADCGDGPAPVDQPWVSFGSPVVAAGLEVVPLVVTRTRAAPTAGRVVRCRSVVVKLGYEQPLAGYGSGNAMAEMMGSILDGETPEFRVDQPGYLIIVPDEFYDDILPLAAWKEQRGFKVWVRKLSETGSTREQIRTYIRNAYNTLIPVPSYVLLVGAVNKIPAFITTGTPCVTDHPYACVDGDDFMPDLFVGRLPAANGSELDVIVAKVRGYEMTPAMSDPSWFRRALMVATSYQEGGTPAVTALITKRIIRERLLAKGFTQVDTVFYPPTRYGQGPVDSAVNRGVSFVNGRGWGNYDGWGYPQFLTNDVYGLDNGWKLPVITSLYCGTGNYARNPCFGEAWLRAGTPTNPKGGIAFWGSSWTGTSTRWNNCMDYGIYRALFDQGVDLCGPAMYLGKLAQYENFPLAEDSFDLRIYFHVYNLLGDPSLQMWTRVPEQLAVSCPATFPVGASSFEVTVQTVSDVPVAGALVCLHKPGEVHETRRTDATGRACFAIATATPDTMFVTVTGRGLVTGLGQSIGHDAGVFVGHQSHSPATVGPGSSPGVEVVLKNFGGSATAPGVQATLRPLDSCATVTDSVRSYGDITPGGTGSASAFAATIAPACTSGQVIPFGLSITSGDSSWLSAFDLPVHGPTLKVVGYTVHDGNGWLDPGEAAEFSVVVRNSGSGSAGNVGVLLTSLNPSAITVLDSLGSLGTIAPGDSASNASDRFRVQAGVGIGVGRRFSLKATMTGDGGFIQTWEFPVTVGRPVPSAPLGPDRYGYYAYDDTDVGCTERPTYDWVEIDPAHGGSGTRVDLGNDKAVPVSLPFTFRFYGRDYGTVSVCDNGYVAMGSSWLGEIYNWHIPSANGPDGFVAAFWDDFRADTLDASGVFTWYDVANHRFIVEWSRCHHVHGFRPPIIAELQTFELMLYDPQYHSTVTGDGPVKVQYLTVQNDDSIFGNNHNFATVGIQNPGHDDGLEYTYAGRYPAAAAEVLPHRAIRFTTNPPDTFIAVREGRPVQRPFGEFRVTPSPVRDRLLVVLPGMTGGIRLDVFNALGRAVRSFDPAGSGARTVEWDLTDGSGIRVPSGVYHIRLTPSAGSGKIWTERITVLTRDNGR